MPTRFSGLVASFTTTSSKAKILVDRHHQIVDLENFRLKLLFRAEDMRVVLRETAHAHQAVQRTRWFVAMNSTEFCKPYREIAVRFQPMLEDLHMTRAIHRLERENPFVLCLLVGALHRKHVLAIPAPVSGGEPKRGIEHLGRVDLLIFVFEPPAHIGKQVLEHFPAL